MTDSASATDERAQHRCARKKRCATLGDDICAETTYPDGMLETGSPAPDFVVHDDEGNARSWRDFAGKTLVLWFYPKADTPG